jgi:hypothetical protein
LRLCSGPDPGDETHPGKSIPAGYRHLFWACIGVSLNRWVMVLQTMAVPVLSFDTWAMYIPSWQEVATTILPLAYGVILIMISYRYLPIFPQERELNPIVSDDVETAAVAGEASADEKLQPAEA